EQELEELKQAILNSEKEQKEIEKNLGLLQKELFLINQKLLELEKRAKLEKELFNLEEQIVKLSSQLSSLSYSKESLEQISKELQQILEKKAIAEQKIQTQKEVLKNLLELHSIYKSEMEKLELKKSTLNSLLDEIDLLKSFEKVLIATQIQLRDYILLKLNNALSMLWPVLYPYSDWSNLRILSSEKGYVIEFYQNGWKEVDVFSSGGEKACVALSLRVALALLLTPSLSWIVLDEPTHNLDENAVSKLADALNTKLPTIIKQILVITHDERLVNLGYCQLIKIERDKNPNSFSTVFIN
ncbi:MAG: hypothetical protein N3D10_02720, partial [Candidatus Micrarchaeota archaeon]|nr:hypothetical protein [Candidatus Micrarchaeota archaeon]